MHPGTEPAEGTLADGDKSNAQVTVALIGALSAVVVALIANWSGVFSGHGAKPVASQGNTSQGDGRPTAASQTIPAPTPGKGAGSATWTQSLPPADFVFPNSDQVELDCAALGGISPAQLRIARNEIYARHGYIFASADLTEHFSQFGWYRPTAANVALSPVEQQNVLLLTKAAKGACSG